MAIADNQNHCLNVYISHYEIIAHNEFTSIINNNNSNTFLSNKIWHNEEFLWKKRWLELVINHKWYDLYLNTSVTWDIWLINKKKLLLHLKPRWLDYKSPQANDKLR